MELDDELDRLYGLSLDRFTEARNDLARELRKRGEREAADAVGGLRKPSISAWAVNQLARTQRLQVRALVTAAEHVRDVQAEVLGGGDAAELRKAGDRQREAIAALVASAKETLAEAGHPATETTLARIRATLTAVAGDEEGRELVAQGRLEHDLDPAGFGALVAGSGAAHTRPRAKAASGAARRKLIAEAKRERDRLQAEVAERKQRVRRAETEARDAERAAQAAQEKVRKEELELAGLAERLAAAAARLERARAGKSSS